MRRNISGSDYSNPKLEGSKGFAVYGQFRTLMSSPATPIVLEHRRVDRQQHRLSRRSPRVSRGTQDSVQHLPVEDSLLQQTLKLSSTRRNLFEFVLQQRDLLHQNATAIIEP